MQNIEFKSFESWQEHYFPNFLFEQEKSKTPLHVDSLASFLAERWTREIIDNIAGNHDAGTKIST